MVPFQKRPDAGRGDCNAHGGQFALDPAVAPVRVLVCQPENEGGRALGDARSTRTAVWVAPALGDEVPVPAQQGCRLDEEAPEALTGEQPCQSRQQGPVGRLEEWPVDLASKDRHLVAQHDYLDGEVRVMSAHVPNQLEEATERPIEEGESHRGMLVALAARRQAQLRAHGCDIRHQQVLSCRYSNPGELRGALLRWSSREWGIGASAAATNVGGARPPL